MVKISTGISAKAIGAAMERLRQTVFHGITQREFANILGVQERRYARWAAGGAIPTGDVVIKLLLVCPDEGGMSLFLNNLRATADRSSEAISRGAVLKIEKLPTKIPQRTHSR